MISAFVKKYPEFEEFRYTLYEHSAVTLEMIEEDRKHYAPVEEMQKSNVSHSLSDNPNLTEKFVLDHMELKWDLWRLNSHPNISIDFIIKYSLRFPCYIVWNPKLTTDYIDKYKNEDLNWETISKHPCVTMDYITKHPEYPWVWEGVYKNPNITLEFVVDHHPEIKWGWWDFPSHLFTIEAFRKYGEKIPWHARIDLTLEFFTRFVERTQYEPILELIVYPKTMYDMALNEIVLDMI